MVHEQGAFEIWLSLQTFHWGGIPLPQSLDRTQISSPRLYSEWPYRKTLGQRTRSTKHLLSQLPLWVPLISIQGTVSEESISLLQVYVTFSGGHWQVFAKMSLTKRLLTMPCFLKWICHDSDENVTRGTDSAGKHSVDARRRSKLKEGKYQGKCHQWPSTKTSTEYCFKKDKTQLKGWEVSQEANAFYWIRRRKAVFTKACLQEKDSLWEVRLLLFLGRDGRKEGTCLSTKEELLTFESQSYSFSHLHVKMSDIICECQKYLQKN